jgi:hypothetical protein
MAKCVKVLDIGKDQFGRPCLLDGKGNEQQRDASGIMQGVFLTFYEGQGEPKNSRGEPYNPPVCPEDYKEENLWSH